MIILVEDSRTFSIRTTNLSLGVILGLSLFIPCR